jgi:hypothetical protein
MEIQAFAEVLFFFQFPIQLDGGQEKIETLAFVSEHAPPHPDIFKKSTFTFWWCTPNSLPKCDQCEAYMHLLFL